MRNLSIKWLKLSNFRCFSSFEIGFHEQLTVLVAPNGAGKTAVLDAVAVALGPYVGAFDEAVGKHFEPDDIRLSRVRETASNEMEYAPEGVTLEAKGYIPGGMFEKLFGDDPEPWWSLWKRTLSGPKKSKTTIKDSKELIKYGKRMQTAARTAGSSDTLPIISYYGTGRLWQIKKLTSAKLARTSRTIAYTDCLEPGSSYKAFAGWFQYWNTNSQLGRLKAMELRTQYERTEFDDYIESVSAAVNTCLAPTGWKSLEYSPQRQELVACHDDHGRLPVSLLSDGVRNMIAMVADIAFRATKLNPGFGSEAAKKTPGIVLIDEVDMHLHPGWQQTVLDSLTKAFPQIQFIVTTHSPQVLTSVRSECIRVLENGKVFSAPPGTEGAEASRLLKRVLGVDVRPPENEATKELKEYLALVDADQWESPRAKELRRKLDARYQGEEPALLEADLQIENRKWELGQ